MKIVFKCKRRQRKFIWEIADLEESAEKMCRTARELKQNFSFQEEKAAESVENPDAVDACRFTLIRFQFLNSFK